MSDPTIPTTDPIIHHYRTTLGGRELKKVILMLLKSGAVMDVMVTNYVTTYHLGDDGKIVRTPIKLLRCVVNPAKQGKLT